MSEHNPFDDEEQFTEQVGVDAIPPEEDITKTGMSREAILDHLTKQINHHFDRNQLAEITIAFEYSDAEGFTSWVTTHYTCAGRVAK